MSSYPPPPPVVIYTLSSLNSYPSKPDLTYGSGHIRPNLSLLLEWCMHELLIKKKDGFFLYQTPSLILLSLFWMGLLSCLTHPSPVSRSQALTGKVTKGCNLPAAECDSGTGCVRNTCEKPPSRQARVSERWWDISVDERERQDPCQDWGERRGEKRSEAWVRSAKWTPLLNVSSVGEMLQKRVLECEFALDLSKATKKKESSGPSCWAELVASWQRRTLAFWQHPRSVCVSACCNTGKEVQTKIDEAQVRSVMRW